METVMLNNSGKRRLTRARICCNATTPMAPQEFAAAQQQDY